VKRLIIAALGLLVTATAASAAMELSYATSGDNVIVTAADGPTSYWEMTVDVGSTRPGRIMGFFDKSGASDETFNYAHSYNFGSGMIDGMDAGEMRSSGKWTLSNLVMGATAMTYTLSRTATRDAGTAVYSMDFTIGLPAATAAGYTTNISILDTFAFDAGWTGANADGRIRARARLNASADNDEYAVATHNGVTEGDPATLSVQATVTGADPAMAAGSTFTQTLAYTLFDTAYDSAAGTYATMGTPYFGLSTDLGITGAWAGNPGPAGSARTYTAVVDLDIAIVPEPATLGLLGLGALALIRRRK